jgi:hypothetical protein
LERDIGGVRVVCKTIGFEFLKSCRFDGKKSPNSRNYVIIIMVQGWGIQYIYI